MSEPVVLFNRNKYRSFQFTLYHAIVCKAEEKCFCGETRVMAKDKRGEFRRAEASVFLPGRGYSKPLPRSVLQIDQVKNALAERPTFLTIANQLADVEVIQPSGNGTGKR